MTKNKKQPLPVDEKREQIEISGCTISGINLALRHSLKSLGFIAVVEELETDENQLALFVHLEEGGCLLSTTEGGVRIGNLDLTSQEMVWAEPPKGSETILAVEQLALVSLWAIGTQLKKISNNRYRVFGRSQDEFSVDLEYTAIRFALERCSDTSFLSTSFNLSDIDKSERLASFASLLSRELPEIA